MLAELVVQVVHHMRALETQCCIYQWIKVYYHLNKAIISNYVISGMYVHMLLHKNVEVQKMRVLRRL
jgi:hypothetical protein